jgi:CHAT domain-containing protein/Tfp pilus assembly protein PilF
LLAAGAQLADAAAPPQSAAVAPTNGSCNTRQLVVVHAQQGWRCTIKLTTRDALVVRVDQRDIDVVVSLQDERGQQALSVDSPTMRAGAEMLLIGPRLNGRYTLVVLPKAVVASAHQALLVMSRFSGPAALLSGLGELTGASAPEQEQTAESGKARIVQLQSALLKFQSADAPQWQAEALLRIAALQFWIVNDWAAAASGASLAMAAFARVDDPVMRAQASVIRAASLLELASAIKTSGARGSTGAAQSPFDEATDLLNSAAAVLQRAGLRYGQAQALNFAGVGFFYQDNYAAARTRYHEAAAIFRSLGDKGSAALPMQNIAHIDLGSGDYAKAITSFKSALEVLDPSADAGQYVTVLINLGTAQYVMGQFEPALRSLTSALEICEKHGFPAEKARSLHGLGMVYLVIGDRDRAQVLLERALELRRPLAQQDPRSLQTSLIRVGDLRREQGDVRGALDLHVQALEAASSPTQRARAFYAIGRDHESNDALTAAAQAYGSGLKLDLPQDFPIRVALLGSYGTVLLRSGDSSGRSLVEQAAQLHEARGDVDWAAQDYVAIAEADRRRNALDSALRNAHKAVSLYESQRLGAVNPDLRATYLASRADAAALLGEIYMTLWDQSSSTTEQQRLSEAALLGLENSRQRALNDFRSLAGSGTAESSTELARLDALLSAKRHRLATLLEQQNPDADAIAGLSNDISLLRTQIDIAQTKPIAPDPSSSHPAGSVDAMQRTLQPRETVLVYQLGADHSRLWRVTRDAVSVTRLSGRTRLEDAARELYSRWHTPAAPVDLKREIAASRILLGDAAASWLHEGGTVVVVTDGILRSVPFGALLIEDRNGGYQRLLTTHEVLFRSTIKGETAAAARAETAINRILLVGDPTAPSSGTAANSVDPWALPPLPGSRREVESIAAIAADWRRYVLLGAEATKPALLSMPLDTFRAIHFATHARLDVQDPQLSSIALSSRQALSGFSSSMLSVREIVGFKLNAETVVLSACEASLGKSYRGQLSFGLSEAFLLAGAHNVLGSLWKVSDDAAQAYMQRFYRAYVRDDQTPAASARMAAVELSRDPAFSHPYFWAAFAVTQR